MFDNNEYTMDFAFSMDQNGEFSATSSDKFGSFTLTGTVN
jgi:hypothetical protein